MSLAVWGGKASPSFSQTPKNFEPSLSAWYEMYNFQVTFSLNSPFNVRGQV